MESGIYKITNIINGKCYFGSTFNFNKRKNSHFSKLESGKHINKHLQASYNMYGKSNFTFEIIQIVDDVSQLVIVEQTYLDMYHDNGVMCYNIAKKAGICSEESRLRRSEGHRGKRHSEETKLKIAAYRTGKKHSIETIEKMTIINQNVSEETRKKLSELAKNRIDNKKDLIKLSLMVEKAILANRKPIISVEIDTQKTIKFDSIADAARYYNINGTSIIDVLKGRTKTAKKKTLRFEYII